MLRMFRTINGKVEQIQNPKTDLGYAFRIRRMWNSPTFPWKPASISPNLRARLMTKNAPAWTWKTITR